jgi:type II secretory pathway component PulJ
MTLVELLVGMTLSLILFGAVLGLLEVFMRQNTIDQNRNEIQDRARSGLDILTRQLRNVAAPSATQAGALELAGPYDLIFQTVDTENNWGPGNTTNQMRVRYCLSTSGSGASTSNAILYRQTQTWTTSTTPAIPSTSACPATGWTSTAYADYQVVNHVTNEINNQDRPVFTYAPIGATASNQINDVEADLFLDPNPGKPPGETELKTGIYLRNDFASPLANFYFTQPNGQITLNASASTDPNGQALSYQWAVNGVTQPGATSEVWVAGSAGSAQYPHQTNVTFTLTVTSTGGLSTTTSQTVKIQ